MNCRINKQRQWVARLILESQCHDNAAFITLTYSDNHVPKTDSGNLTLVKKELQNFVMRLRNHSDGQYLRYFAVGEYGTKTFRPHYHAILFGLDPLEAERATTKAWTLNGSLLGHIQSAEVNDARLQYVAHYTTKKMTKNNDERLEDRNPEFMLCSRMPGIGFPYIDRLVKAYKGPRGAKALDLLGDIVGTLRRNGRIWPMDDYLKSKLRKELGIPEREISRRMRYFMETGADLPGRPDITPQARTRALRDNDKHTRRAKSHGTL